MKKTRIRFFKFSDGIKTESTVPLALPLEITDYFHKN
jgi:hypothetical protein